MEEFEKAIKEFYDFFCKPNVIGGVIYPQPTFEDVRQMWLHADFPLATTVEEKTKIIRSEIDRWKSMTN